MATWRGLPAITQGGPGACFGCGSALARDGDQVLHLFARRDVPWQGCGRVEQGGPMYFIREGLGEKWKPLAIFFAACGLFGCLPLLQSNQLTQIVRSMFFEPQGWFVGDAENTGNGLFGLLLAVLVGLVVVGESGASEPSRPSLFRYGPPLRRHGSVILLLYADAVWPAFSSSSPMPSPAKQWPVSPRYRHRDRRRRAAFPTRRAWGPKPWLTGRPRPMNRPRGPGRDVGSRHRHPLHVHPDRSRSSGHGGLEFGRRRRRPAHHTSLRAGPPGVGPYLLLAGVLCLSFSSMLGFSYYAVKCGCFFSAKEPACPFSVFTSS